MASHKKVQVSSVRTQPSLSVVHPLFAGEEKTQKLRYLFIVVAIILAGVGSGYGLSQIKNTDNPASAGQSATEEGIKNSEQFPDETAGILQVNEDTSTEGTHLLIREGGPSQTVHLTSSVVDLTKFEGKKVKVMGETFSSQKAGWLMDVGWIEVIK